MITALKETVLLADRRDVLRIHLYFKLIEKGIKPFENDMEIIIELYMFGGYKNAKQQSSFITSCIDKGLKKSPQSLRNTLSTYVTAGIFIKPKNTVLYVNEEYLPKVDCDRLILQHIISHAK